MIMIVIVVMIDSDDSHDTDDSDDSDDAIRTFCEETVCSSEGPPVSNLKKYFQNIEFCGIGKLHKYQCCPTAFLFQSPCLGKDGHPRIFIHLK